MSTLYVLLLEEDKLYVGKSNNISTRYKYHQMGICGEWTKKYKLIGFCQIINNAENYDVDLYTIYLMSKYGVDCVRGDGMRELVLSEIQTQYIDRFINKTNMLPEYCKPIYYSKQIQSYQTDNIVD